jgi:hypothetical protein
MRPVSQRRAPLGEVKDGATAEAGLPDRLLEGKAIMAGLKGSVMRLSRPSLVPTLRRDKQWRPGTVGMSGWLCVPAK